MRAAIRFRISHHPDAEPAHRFRVAQVKTGLILNSSEGYPTFQHAERHVRGVWTGICNQITDAVGLTTWEMPPIPWHRDTYKPKRRAGAVQ